jgi:hypothetical protein
MATTPLLNFSISNKRKPIVICDGFIFQLDQRSSISGVRTACARRKFTPITTISIWECRVIIYLIADTGTDRSYSLQRESEERIVKETTAIGKIY